jgi:hypothetical protein
MRYIVFLKSLSAPQPLDASHRLEEFDCGKPALTDWLRLMRFIDVSVSSQRLRTSGN